jgi:hypothetical protein
MLQVGGAGREKKDKLWRVSTIITYKKLFWDVDVSDVAVASIVRVGDWLIPMAFIW